MVQMQSRLSIQSSKPVTIEPLLELNKPKFENKLTVVKKEEKT